MPSPDVLLSAVGYGLLLPAVVAVLALVTVVWPDWIEIVTDSAPDGGSGALERAVVGVLAATAILLAVVARAEWRRAAVAAR